MAKACAEAYFAARAEIGFPLAEQADADAAPRNLPQSQEKAQKKGAKA